MEDEKTYTDSSGGGTSPFIQNDIDLQFHTIEPDWGKEISSELKKVLARDFKIETIDSNGEPLTLTYNDVSWKLLDYYKRDLRLGNLNDYQIFFSNEWINFAGDGLNMDYKKSFITALTRVISVVELSQSKQGFVRKLFSTIRHENITRDEPEKKGLFGQKIKSEYGGEM
jgi:hypothetical protein